MREMIEDKCFEPHKMLNWVFRVSRAAKLNLLLLSSRTPRH
jgi:hypothetical protein